MQKTAPLLILLSFTISLLVPGQSEDPLGAEPPQNFSQIQRSPNNSRAPGPPALLPMCSGPTQVRSAFKYINTCASCFVFLFGIVGNVTLLKIIREHRGVRSGSSILIASLALGDVLRILIDIPISVYRLLAVDWPFGLMLCKLVPFVQKTSVGVTVLSLCALSVERYRVVCSRRVGASVLRWAGPTLLLIWGAAALLAVPEAAAFNTITLEYRGERLRICLLDPQQSSLFMKVYKAGKDWWLFGFYFLLPLTCTAFFYGRMSWALLRGGSRRSERNPHLKQRREAARAVLCLVLAFALCWAPLHLSRILKKTVYNEQDPHRCDILSLFLVLDYVSITLSWLGSCVNPVALYAVSRSFRRRFQSSLCCWRSSPVLDNTDETRTFLRSKVMGPARDSSSNPEPASTGCDEGAGFSACSCLQT